MYFLPQFSHFTLAIIINDVINMKIFLIVWIALVFILCVFWFLSSKNQRELDVSILVCLFNLFLFFGVFFWMECDMEFCVFC